MLDWRSNICEIKGAKGLESTWTSEASNSIMQDYENYLLGLKMNVSFIKLKVSISNFTVHKFEK